MLDEKLIHALIGGEGPKCGPTELSVNPWLTCGHGFRLLDLWYFREGGERSR
jgi:hypothetical protein